MLSYRQLQAFHIGSQHGVFIDEVVPVGDAGTMVFSRRESEPMWNLFFADDLPAALSRQAEIAAAFAARQRRMIWYLPDPQGDGLPAGTWQATAQNTWMVRPQGVPDGAGEASSCRPPRSAAGFPGEVVLQPVTTLAQGRILNQIYLDVFWGESPPAGVALPFDPAPPAREAACSGFDTRHWLLMAGDEALVILTTIIRDGLCGLYNVGTHPRFTRRGLASHAIRAALAEIAPLSPRGSFLLTENASLAPFYARLGYQTVTTGSFHTLREADR